MVKRPAEQLVAMTCTDPQGVDAQCRSCLRPAGSRPAKAGASGVAPRSHCRFPHRLALIASQA